MPITISRGTSDDVLEAIVDALRDFEHDHPDAEIDLYRQSRVSVRVRIVDPSFQGLDRPQRHALAWKYLEQLPEEVQGDLSMLLLLTPDEVPSSFANFEFNDPIPSTLT